MQQSFKSMEIKDILLHNSPTKINVLPKQKKAINERLKAQNFGRIKKKWERKNFFFPDQLLLSVEWMYVVKFPNDFWRFSWSFFSASSSSFSVPFLSCSGKLLCLALLEAVSSSRVSVFTFSRALLQLLLIYLIASIYLKCTSLLNILSIETSLTICAALLFNSSMELI